MRTPRPSRWALLLFSGLVAWGPPGRGLEPPAGPTQPPAEETPADPAQDPAESDAVESDAVEEDERNARTGPGRTLLKIEADLDCMVTVGLDPPLPLVAGEELTVETEPGAVRVQAYATSVPEARAYEDVTLEAGDRRRVRLKMAKALEDLRKLEARERTYRDPESRLMWPTQDNGSDLTWAEARKYCDELRHGGWEDWRLPTLEELDSLEAMWSMRQFKTADPITLTSCCPWSADRIDEENAWNFNYQYRRPFRGHLSYSLSLRALCVRDGSDEIPENTRRNRRLAKREAKEKRKEKLRREAEKEAAEAAARAEEDAEKDGEDDGEADGSGDGAGL